VGVVEAYEGTYCGAIVEKSRLSVKPNVCALSGMFTMKETVWKESDPLEASQRFSQAQNYIKELEDLVKERQDKLRKLERLERIETTTEFKTVVICELCSAFLSSFDDYTSTSKLSRGLFACIGKTDLDCTLTCHTLLLFCSRASKRKGNEYFCLM
jgi:hypothetical protein